MTEKADSQEIAVLITCFNRCDSTLRCLRALAKQPVPHGYALRVFLTDDGSTDGTGQAVRSEFPDVTVLDGDGNLFWAGGMRVAWKAARPAAFYLWLNDDVELRSNVLHTLLHVHETAGDPATIVVGATCDPRTHTTCTGGMLRKNWHNVQVIEPTDHPRPCDTFNGNIVLVPKLAEEQLGSLDEAYTHFFADGDYGLRARKQDIPVLLAPKHLGECQLNSLANTSFDHRLNIRQRWNKMFGPKGYRPPREWWAFVRAHAPHPKFLYWITPYVLFGLESLFGGRIRLRRNVQRPIEITY